MTKKITAEEEKELFERYKKEVAIPYLKQIAQSRLQAIAKEVEDIFTGYVGEDSNGSISHERERVKNQVLQIIQQHLD